MSEDPFANWPKTADGRLLCSPEHPMPIGNGAAHERRWAHTNIHEVGLGKDGYPSLGFATIECKDCGMVWDAEIAQ